MSRCDMPKILKNSYKPSSYLIACPTGFLMSGSGIQKDWKKYFEKYQYTKQAEAEVVPSSSSVKVKLS